MRNYKLHHVQHRTTQVLASLLTRMGGEQDVGELLGDNDKLIEGDNAVSVLIGLGHSVSAFLATSASCEAK